MQLGCVPDVADARDYPSRVATVSSVPSSHSLRGGMPAVTDQGALASCTAHAIGAAYQYAQARAGVPAFSPSRLAVYFDARALAGAIGQDCGAQIRDAMKAFQKKGVASESLWPYDAEKFAEPPDNAYRGAALAHRCRAYEAVDQDALRWHLAAGYPVVCGVYVSPAFKTAIGGAIGMPSRGERSIGFHAVLLVGYDETTYTFRNSWGAGWGDGGYGTLPREFVEDAQYASAFWILRGVT